MAKAVKKQALGRGLSALLNNPSDDIRSVQDRNADKVVGNIVEIALANIEVNPFQPRTYFNQEGLNELAGSIKELGVIQPITVRKLEGNKFQLVSGERRFRASSIAGLKTIPAYIRLANDQEMLEMALVENIQRKDLDPIEVALSYQRLIEEIKLTQEELSKRVGKNRSTVTNFLRLLKLDPIIQTGIRDGFVSMGHGKALISIENHAEQLELYEKIIRQKLSVRQTEALVKRNKHPQSKPKTPPTLPEFAVEGAAVISDKINRKVSVQVSKNSKGKITIPFATEEEFNAIIKHFE
ncbi:ParB/RepB/Spo0J family partition protein [Flavobacteriaceae bacterium F08102]|nr:ParB/RepB/Spo0J family partition protein [Flavobacteriaceae bacterium F08102]